MPLLRVRCAVSLIAGKGDYGDIMLARVDAGPDAGQQSLVVVKSLLSSAGHHQRAFDHEAEMFGHTSDCHVVRLLGVCCSLQPPLIVTDYCQLVCTSLEVAPTALATSQPTVNFFSVFAVSCSTMLP